MDRPRSRTQPASVRKEQLLDAAESILLERGLAATTVADVAQAAGVAKGTMYLQFESKAELLAALRARYVDRLTDAALAPEDEQVSVQQLVHRLVAGLFDFSVANGRMHHLLFHEAGFSEADVFERARTRLEKHLSAAQRRGDLTLIDVEGCALFLLHGLHGLLVRGLGEGKRSRRRFIEVAEQLTQRVLDGT
jgi:AcrR family transcriptional regulator